MSMSVESKWWPRWCRYEPAPRPAIDDPAWGEWFYEDRARWNRAYARQQAITFVIGIAVIITALLVVQSESHP